MKKQTEFKLDKRDSVWFQDNTAAVNCANAKEVCDIAILPIGAIEPNSTDLTAHAAAIPLTPWVLLRRLPESPAP